MLLGKKLEQIKRLIITWNCRWIQIQQKQKLKKIMMKKIMKKKLFSKKVRDKK